MPPGARATAKSFGLKRYFSGRPCPRGHVCMRRVKDWECVECHQAKARAKQRQYRARDPEKFNARGRARWQNPAVKVRHREWKREWRRQNPDILRAQQNQPRAKLMKRVRERVKDILRRRSIIRTASTRALLGCTAVEACQHLERLFQPGMSWENWGFGLDKWHLDHRIPISSFDLADPEQLARACHYTNLQPLWQPENLAKGASLPPR